MYHSTAACTSKPPQLHIHYREDSQNTKFSACVNAKRKTRFSPGSAFASPSGRGDSDRLYSPIGGSNIVGTRIRAPFAIHPEVYVLPMENVLPTKGTGVVTSTDDYQTVMGLRRKAAFYGIKPEWAAIDSVPVLSTPAYGEMTAPAIVKELKFSHRRILNSWRRRKKSGLAFAYAEPGFVLSRSGDECVVPLMDQRYLDYGEDKKLSLVAEMEVYSPETRHAFEKSWLVRSMGVRSNLWTGFRATLGPTLLGGISE
ncbi:hypothetical protein M378DRAFT_23986 [Amanita muscaria Koide BX008]|uniref:Uncharacterized protein n=1 Tax=Amanita muscaria (strain Koide BX008) TaxID=946122 RepID=A0A0C2X9A3_AMAMK|nr:hypothetical protein M378DRAFT_23986 [Amanita muscaria Koide BX008]